MRNPLKSRRLTAALAAGGLLAAVGAYAVVGEQINKVLSQGIEETLPAEWTEPNVAEHAFVKYLRYYVPAQTADGAATKVEYKADTADNTGAVLKTRDYAKPAISAFMYGPAYVPLDAGGFIGHGRRDIYAALSLDDGTTWKNYNLSESADKSSFDVTTALKDPADGKTSITAYPGDAVNVAMGVAGNKVVVAWPSRYCSTGNAAYTLTPSTDPESQKTTDVRDAVAAYLGIDVSKDLYLTDAFGVKGDQGSVDYADPTSKEPIPSVGEVPFNCLWSARGVMVDGDDPRTSTAVEKNHIVWFKAERLTSGVRDVNRVEVDFVKDAGAVIVWQEDPDGLRPGSGDGPGEGWSGATAGSKTDIWYSFLPYKEFDVVTDPTDTSGTKYVPLSTYWPASYASGKPQHFVPFAVPMRLTNNDGCTGANPSPFCTADATLFGLKNQCSSTITLTKGNQNSNESKVCVSEDGLPGLGNTAAVRPRVALRPKLDDSGATIGAWVVVINEEDKGLGNFAVLTSAPNTIVDCDPDASQTDECVKFDDGKNIWYHSFDMGQPATSKDTSATSLVKNLVSQGNMINQPEVDWQTGQMLAPMSTANLWDFPTDFDIYRTEIARRGSLMVQSPLNVDEGNSKLMAMLLFKQGLVNQGGPADIMARRIVDSGQSANPYDFSNLVCGSKSAPSPYYPKGVCLEPAINLSGTTPQTCAVSSESTGADGTCPTVSSTGVASDDPNDETLFDKMTNWFQCPGSPLCNTTDLSTAMGSNLDDQSWFNPLDVAKGHRGYLWGDMAVVMYAWSPNWKLNAKGKDRYELYIRRSFDGGKTWTTTPATWGGKGTTTCETMRDGETSAEQTSVCTEYAAGAVEQARNVSQLKSKEAETPTNKYTILDPRYAPDPPTMPDITGTGTDPDSDVFNPSRFMIVFEAGDNKSVATTGGEAEPLDLWYGRAVNFGDHYQVTSEEQTLLGLNTFNNEFLRLTTGSGVAAEEASLAMSPAGDTLYAVWAQEATSSGHTAEFARVWYDDANFTTTTPPFTYVEPRTRSGGGCSAATGERPVDPVLPLLAALGLIGWGLRRARRS